MFVISSCRDALNTCDLYSFAVCVTAGRFNEVGALRGDCTLQCSECFYYTVIIPNGCVKEGDADVGSEADLCLLTM